MKKNQNQYALQALAHPLALASLGVILLNALILQPLAPSWLTGKLSDLAWMVVLPLAIAALLSPIWSMKDKRSLFWISAALAGAGFSLLKTLPAANHAAGALFLRIFQMPLKLALDPTDLLALAGLPLAGWIWRQDWTRAKRQWRFVPIFLLVLTGLADAPDPGYYQVDCVAVYGDTLIAFTPERATGYFLPGQERKVYTSIDNGQTWIDQGVFTLREMKNADLLGDPPLDDLLAQCPMDQDEFTITDPQNANIQYVILSENGVYRSEDNGNTLTLEFDAEQNQTIFENAVFAPDGETLVIAATYDGILLRLPDGAYERIDPSGMSVYEP